MFYFVKQLGKGQRRCVIRRLVFCGLTAAALMIVSGRTRGALILPVSPTDVPVSDPASVFDASHAGNVYALEPGTTLANPGFDLRDLFGGSFATVSIEQGYVDFNNFQLPGTVSAVDVTLAAPVSLTSFNLFLEDNVPGFGSASEFKLFADGQLVDDVPILSAPDNRSYADAYGSNCIAISDTFTGLPSTSDYTLEWIQNQGPGPASGVDALEFEATGSASSVPESASMAAVAIGGIALWTRRRRI